MSTAETSSPIVWGVGVLTAPRPGVPTITATLQSLAEAGWPADVTVTVDSGRSGCWQGWLSALRNLLLASPSANWLLLAEDDCQLSAGLRSHLEWRISFGSVNNSAWYSLYCAAGLHDPDLFDWQEVSTPRQCWGSVAYLFGRRLAERLLARTPHPEWRDGTDQAVGQFCRSHRIPYLVFSPSFVKHTGEISSLDQPGGQAVNRQCGAWIQSIYRTGNTKAGCEWTYVVEKDGGGNVQAMDRMVLGDSAPPG